MEFGLLLSLHFPMEEAPGTWLLIPVFISRAIHTQILENCVEPDERSSFSQLWRPEA